MSQGLFSDLKEKEYTSVHDGENMFEYSPIIVSFRIHVKHFYLVPVFFAQGIVSVTVFK